MTRLVDAVRAASSPAPDADAARRVADTAWARSGLAARAGLTANPPARPRIPRTVHRWGLAGSRGLAGRWGLAAAAVLVAAAGVFVVRPTEPAFAVDGDPVQVWNTDRWEESRTVPAGATVHAAEGTRTLRGPDGAEIVPEPGTTFRIATGSVRGRFHVEILAGAAEVAGESLRLSLADLDVEPGTRGAYRAFAALTADGLHGVPPSPPRGLTAALASVRIELGDAVLTRRSTGERMDLRHGRAAALVPSGDGGTALTLRSVADFGPDVELQIATGHPVVEFLSFGDDGIALLGGPDGRVSAIGIREHDMTHAVESMNRAMHVLVTRMDGEHARVARVHAATSEEPDDVALEVRAFRSGTRVTEASYEAHGHRVRVVVEDGRVSVHSDGSTRTYDSVAAAQAAEGETIAPLLSTLSTQR